MLSYAVAGIALENPTRWLREEGVGEALAAPAWRGEDLLIPGLAGQVPLSRVRDVDVDQFVVNITGDVDSTGAQAADRCTQLLTNIRALQQLLVPADGGTVQVTRTLTTAAGTLVQGPRTCRCVSSLAPRLESPTFARVLVQLKVYQGWT